MWKYQPSSVIPQRIQCKLFLDEKTELREIWSHCWLMVELALKPDLTAKPLFIPPNYVIGGAPVFTVL